MNYQLEQYVRKHNGEVIFDRDTCAVYKNDGSCYFVTHHGKRAADDDMMWSHVIKQYQIDDAPYAIDTIIDLTKEGCSFWENAGVHYPKGSQNGKKLWHYLVAAYGKVPVNLVFEVGVRVRERQSKDKVDLRISNMECRAVDTMCADMVVGNNRIVRNYDVTCIINQEVGAITKTDYIEWLYQFLRQKKNDIVLQEGDYQAKVPVNKKMHTLSEICIAIQEYGIPLDETELSNQLTQLTDKCKKEELGICHLNTDKKDNRLCNLMLMPFAQKYETETSMQKIIKLKLPVFCWLKSIDDKQVAIKAGYLHSTKEPDFRVDTVVKTGKLPRVLDDFLCTIAHEREVREFFEQKDRQKALWQ